jgi:hypothetical protein
MAAPGAALMEHQYTYLNEGSETVHFLCNVAADRPVAPSMSCPAPAPFCMPISRLPLQAWQVFHHPVFPNEQNAFLRFFRGGTFFMIDHSNSSLQRNRDDG